MVRSLRKLERIGDKGGGGDPLDGEGVQAVVFPREEKERGKVGSGMGMRARIESRQDAGKKGKRTVHEYGGCGIMPWLHKNGVLVDPDTNGERRAHGNSDLACIVWAS